jgi:membrane-bound lytic murein transglycosylase A
MSRRAIPTGSWWPPKRVNNPGRGPLRAIGSLPGVACALWLAGATPAATQPALTIPDAALEPMSFNELEGWAADDRAAAFAAFLASCRVTLKKPDADPRPMAGALRAVCARARAAGPLNSARAAAFFEANFRPMQIFKLGETSGFLTGYYEPIVEGSRLPTPIFHTPLYRRPDDLVVLGAPHGTDGFPNKAAVGRKIDDRILPGYFDRGAIEDGALDGRHLEICWIKDPIDALIIQIQGSARIRLEDGLILRVNYDAHNGWPYTPVGRPLIERNIIPREEMSLDRLRTWMQLNPDAAREVRRTNRSFVFFRISGLGNEEEPIGGEGVRLTAGRSLAVDKTLHVYGTPFFVEAALPLGRTRAPVAFHRLMIAQDTGSAMVGPARADLYFGAGEEAGHVAGAIRQNARMVMLIPREIDPAAVRAPRPLPRPAFEAQAAREKANKEDAHRHRGAKSPHRRGGHPWAP